MTDLTAAHDLIVSLGDEEVHGTCSCGTYLGYLRPDQSLDLLGRAWDTHLRRPSDVPRSPGRIT